MLELFRVPTILAWAFPISRDWDRACIYVFWDMLSLKNGSLRETIKIPKILCLWIEKSSIYLPTPVPIVLPISWDDNYLILPALNIHRDARGFSQVTHAGMPEKRRGRKWSLRCSWNEVLSGYTRPHQLFTAMSEVVGGGGNGLRGYEVRHKQSLPRSW